MDPHTTNRLGHIRQKEILDWAARQPHSRPWTLRGLLARIWRPKPHARAGENPIVPRTERDVLKEFLDGPAGHSISAKRRS
jgi:hypothetical protein